MEFLALLFVGKPQTIAVVAILFLLGYLVLRTIAKSSSLHPHPLLILSIAWGMYAVWEMLVQMQTPEANIRIDLLVIWPILGILTAWKLFRVFR